MGTGDGLGVCMVRGRGLRHHDIVKSTDDSGPSNQTSNFGVLTFTMLSSLPDDIPGCLAQERGQHLESCYIPVFQGIPVQPQLIASYVNSVTSSPFLFRQISSSHQGHQ